MRQRYSTEHLPSMERMAFSDLTTAEIKQRVREALAGFQLRQKWREWTRQQKRKQAKEQANGPRPMRPQKGNEVKSPIVFRATFRGPRWTTFNLPGPVEVEIYHSQIGPPAEWRARRPGTRAEFEHYTPQSTPATMQRQWHLFFVAQLSDWKAFDTTPGMKPYELQPGDWSTDNQGKVHLTKDYLDTRAARIAGLIPPRTVAQAIAEGPRRVK